MCVFRVQGKSRLLIGCFPTYALLTRMSKQLLIASECNFVSPRVMNPTTQSNGEDSPSSGIGSGNQAFLEENDYKSRAERAVASLMKVFYFD